MTKRILFFVLLFIVSYLLFTSKETHTNEVVDTENAIITKENPLLTKVLTTALSYKGVPYKFGGTTKSGMDCSGLVFTSYKEINITLNRASRNMYYDGVEVALGDVKQGDLLFFDIDKFEGKVNHVGMVTSVQSGIINFIHSTTSKGVIITSIEESYWKKAFIKAKRIVI